jgi:Na+-driven multidrug efflux pump
LIPRYGAVGAAIASICAYGFYGIASIITVARLDGVPPRTLLFASRSEMRELVSALRSRG